MKNVLIKMIEERLNTCKDVELLDLILKLLVLEG